MLYNPNNITTIFGISYPPVKDEIQRNFSQKHLQNINTNLIRFSVHWKNIEKSNEIIQILNNINDEELQYYYSLADIFVLPQRNDKEDKEGFGIVFLEAGYYNLPIIAGNKGGPLEILNNSNSILIEQDKQEELKEALKLLITNESKRKELGHNIKESILKFSSSPKQSNKLKEILS